MSFGNPIVGKEDLLRAAIRSPNYIAGVSGWRIAQDGSAEFNNVVIRGDLQSDNFVAGTSGWRLQRTGTAQLDSVDLLGSLTLLGSGKIRTATSGVRLEISAGAQNTLAMPTDDGSETSFARIAHTIGAGATRRILVSIESGSLTATNPSRINLFSESANGATPGEIEIVPRGLLDIGADKVAITRIGTETADTGLFMENSWIRIVGSGRGVYWQDQGGGWFMENTSFMRCYGEKDVLIHPAIFGRWPPDTRYAMVGNKDWRDVNSAHYALLAGFSGSPDTYIGASGTGGSIFFRQAFNGADLAKLTATSGPLQLAGLANDAASTSIGVVAVGALTRIVTKVSSGRFKRNVVPLDLEEEDPFWSIRPVRHLWDELTVNQGKEMNERYPQGVPGLIAEQVGMLYPEAVTWNAMGQAISFDEQKLIALLVAAVRQLRRRLVTLERRVPA